MFTDGSWHDVAGPCLHRPDCIVFCCSEATENGVSSKAICLHPRGPAALLRRPGTRRRAVRHTSSTRAAWTLACLLASAKTYDRSPEQASMICLSSVPPRALCQAVVCIALQFQTHASCYAPDRLPNRAQRLQSNRSRCNEVLAIARRPPLKLVRQTHPLAELIPPR